MIDTAKLVMGSQSGSQLDSIVRKSSSFENKAAKSANPGELEQTFQDFVGQSFFGQLLSTMRESVGKSEYFNGGRGEEVFQGQLDQVMAEELSDASAESFSKPMFDLFMLRRS